MVRPSRCYVGSKEIGVRVGEWLEYVRARVAPRPHLRLSSRRSALLVIDMLQYFASPEGRCFLPVSRVVTPNIARLVHLYRDIGAPVFFLRHGHESREDLGMLGRFFHDYIRADEDQAAIIGELRPRPNEVSLRKTTYDGFLGTKLEKELRERHIDQVLITGVLTHLCCDTTARSAFCRGFEVYVAADATASSTEELHVGALLGLADGVACVASTKEILDNAG